MKGSKLDPKKSKRVLENTEDLLKIALKASKQAGTKKKK